MKFTLESLMQTVGCAKYPDRWAEIFDTVMRDFDKNGCPLTDPAYYDRLHRQYNAFPLHLATYKEAATAVGRSEPLSRLLALLVASLSASETAWEDVKAFSAPKTADGSPDLATDMLTGLAICCQIPYMHDLLTKRRLPEDVILRSVQVLEKGVDQYAMRHDGIRGYDLLEWFQRNIFGHLYRIHRLEIEIFAKFSGRAKVFENDEGERIALAHDITLHRSGWALGAKNYTDEAGSFYAEVQENETDWMGFPYDDRGFVKKTAVTLSKDKWHLVLEYGDPVVSLHIPADGRLDAESVDETLAGTKEFLRTYFPDYTYKAFYCNSWLLDPRLATLVGPDSNIAKFGKRFAPLTAKSEGNAVFRFVFLKSDPKSVDITTLPESTRLERALKAHYLAGKCIYEVKGYFFSSEQYNGRLL
ncbi:MAG: hypothetical protein E7590_10190 [Ruminococcaceae bacterium]|nr:hypothetical protein [Oscillospiraceae bacterium]MBE6703024.1 hypothetical protein [Oscillospiraceae bacterium]